MMLKVCFCLLLACAAIEAFGSRLVGGQSAYNPTTTDPEVRLALGSINNFYEANRNGQAKTTKLLFGSKQVVAGIKYYLTFEVTGEDDAVEICQVSAWSRPWLSAMDASDAECGVPRSVLGNIENYINMRLNSIHYVKVVGQPDFVAEGDNFKVSNARLFRASCDKTTREVRLAVGTALLDDLCVVDNNAQVIATCSADVSVENDSFSTTNINCSF